MERSFDIELYSIDQAVLVDVTVTYKITEDSMGCHEFNRNLYTTEVLFIKASLNNRFYKPTSEDLKCWESDIDRALDKDFQSRDSEAA